MRVFVTGASGFIGEAVVRELQEHGHRVLALVRSDANAEKLEAMGCELHRGNLQDFASLAEGAKSADGVIQLAFDHDFSRAAEAAAMDRQAFEAIAEALAGTGKPLVWTFGLAGIAPGRVATEEDDPVQGMSVRNPLEAQVQNAAGRGIRSSLMRVPIVHGAGDRGFLPALLEFGRRAGGALVVGDGANRWPAVHRLDVARLYRLALESAPAGARLHAVAEEGIPLRAIAETISAGLGLPVREISSEQASEYLGWLTRFATADIPASSTGTRRLLGWEPTGPDLLADMRENYFA